MAKVKSVPEISATDMFEGMDEAKKVIDEWKKTLHVVEVFIGKTPGYDPVNELKELGYAILADPRQRRSDAKFVKYRDDLVLMGCPLDVKKRRNDARARDDNNLPDVPGMKAELGVGAEMSFDGIESAAKEVTMAELARREAAKED